MKNFTALGLCVIMALVYGVQATTGFYPGFNASVSPAWKFVTSIFGHSSLHHLFNNLFFLGLFGTIYERFTSSRTFLLTFLAAGLFANLSAFIFYPDSYIIGASGAAYGVLGALAVYKPNQIGLALGVPLPMWAVLIAYTFVNLAGTTGATDTAYQAHLFGMVIGGVIGLHLRERPKKKKKDEDDPEIQNWKQKIREWEDRYML